MNHYYIRKVIEHLVISGTIGVLFAIYVSSVAYFSLGLIIACVLARTQIKEVNYGWAYSIIFVGDTIFWPSQLWTRLRITFEDYEYEQLKRASSKNQD